MADNTPLDAAIGVADHKVKERYDQKQKRRHARALIAEVLKDVERKLKDEPLIPAAQAGARAVLSEIRFCYGLEDEA